jgi:hypothetical protein
MIAIFSRSMGPLFVNVNQVTTFEPVEDEGPHKTLVCMSDLERYYVIEDAHEVWKALTDATVRMAVAASQAACEAARKEADL